MTRSLRRLREVTEAIAAGALDTRVENLPGTPEIRSLSHSFNVMADRLTRLIETQRNFASDASHQLRTPLTALRIRLENARDAIADDPAIAVERIADAEAELARLNALVEGLLSLSRAELAQAKTTQQDIAVIAVDRVEQWEPLAKESGVDITYEGPQHAFAFAVETAAEQIIDNCLDNAIAASPTGSTITVKVHVTAERVTAHVLDEGRGMTDEQIDRAFDRFWRGTTNSPGTGLGLAIVDQLARASGTRAHIKRRPNTGLDVYVDFNAASANEPI
ncbi:MAG: HAMP domain-containing histidine kinase [Nocardiaceae bacterium]|nr:HAMP domain-containing histidine kinase [Nocardiaceae bacterium]